MELDFSPVWAGFPALLHGALVTIEVTAASLLLGALLGLLVGIGRLNPKRRLIYGICTVYVGAIRGTPLLVQLFLLFFGLPQFNILLPAFLCGMLGLGIYSGAYVSEIVRGGFQNAYLGYYGFAGQTGQGLMTAGLRAVARHAFEELGLHRLEANIQPGNTASRALARRCGFQQEGYSPRYLRIGGEWRDHERWALRAD